MSKVKSGDELYRYCYAKMHTKNWIQELKNEGIRAINYGLENFSPVGQNGYYLEKIEMNCLTPIDKLWLILEDQCHESVTFDTVYYAANRVFKDISQELERMFSVPSYYVMFCANKRKETVFFFGPWGLDKGLLFSDEGIFMTLGYDILIDFLDRANQSSLSELCDYLESMGFWAAF